MSRCKFHPGDTVYVLERDDWEDVYDVSGYMFLAQVAHGIICCPWYNNLQNVDEMIEHFIEETSMDNDLLSLRVFPVDDCYYDLEEARAVAAEEGLCAES